MDVAPASLSTVNDSMSFGLTKDKGLIPVLPPRFRVLPAVSVIGTPSMTIKGWLPEFIEFTPLTRITAAEPRTPEAFTICVPADCPCSNWSAETTCRFSMASCLTIPTF